jgi:hypothetical protein
MQVRQVNSLARYPMAVAQAHLQAFVLDTIQFCALCGDLWQRAVTRMRQDNSYPMPFGGFDAPSDLSSALEKDDEDFPERFFWSGTLVVS